MVFRSDVGAVHPLTLSLYRCRGQGGGGTQAYAYEFIAPYASSQIPWTPPHGKDGDQGGARADVRDLLVFASVHYTDTAFRALLGPQLSDSGYTKERWRLFIAP
ncbi:MAG: hypothetical protein LBK99_22705 [Opitutaceae bacterium]|nr:hypothetical protein [Opitutaceae bacterium]